MMVIENSIHESVRHWAKEQDLYCSYLKANDLHRLLTTDFVREKKNENDLLDLQHHL